MLVRIAHQSGALPEESNIVCVCHFRFESNGFKANGTTESLEILDDFLFSRMVDRIENALLFKNNCFERQ